MEQEGRTKPEYGLLHRALVHSSQKPLPPPNSSALISHVSAYLYFTANNQNLYTSPGGLMLKLTTATAELSCVEKLTNL